MKRALGLLGVLLATAVGGACSPDEAESSGCDGCDGALAGTGGDAPAAAGGDASAGSESVEASAGSTAGGQAPLTQSGDAGYGAEGGGNPGPRDPLFGTSCPQPQVGMFRTSCSFEQTCEQLGCGDGASRYDGNGCDRSCTTSADCGAGERCRFGVLWGRGCQTSSEVEGCELVDGQCSCMATTDCVLADICVDAEAYPGDIDCPTAEELDCGVLSEMRDQVEFPAETTPEEKAKAMTACGDAVRARQTELGCITP